MGYVRIILATVVLFGHFVPAGWHIITTDAAVQGFFMVSGFYMFLILDRKYDDIKIFYINRVLRIYPSYLFILFLAILAALTLGANSHYYPMNKLVEEYSKLNLISATYLIFTNAAILGQDLVTFFYIDGNSLAWTNAFFKYPEGAAYKLLVIPQAWSVDLELWFYLCVPFFVRLKSPIIAGLIAISFAARAYVYSLGAPWFIDPWAFRFFPFEVALFLTGGLLYRATAAYRSFFTKRLIGNILVALIAAYCVGYAVLPNLRYGQFLVKYDIFIMLLACSLPFLHCSLPYIGANRFLGDLSYPIYINHLFIFNLIATLPWMGSHIFSVIGVTCSFMLAMFMVRYIESPIDRYRQSLLSKKRATA